MAPLEIFGLQFLMSLLVVSLIAKFYVAPWLAQKSTNDALMILLVPHMFRHIGMSFLVPGLVGPSLAGSFAGAAAYGDLISAFAAVICVIALRMGWGFAIILVWLFNIVGTVDLINALRQAEVIPQLGVTWFIPTFIVPVLLVSHAMIFARLLKKGD